ncbi:hypothetical protein [Streptomyces sp. NPDC058545]
MAPSTVEDVTIQVLGGFRVVCAGEELPAERWSRPSDGPGRVRGGC